MCDCSISQPDNLIRMGQRKPVVTPVAADHKVPNGALLTDDKSHNVVGEMNNNVDSAAMTSNSDAMPRQQAGQENASTSAPFRPEIRWPDLIVQIFLHVGALYGISLVLSMRWITLVWCK